KVRVREVGFVAAGNHHRCAVAGADVSQCHQDIDLSTLEAPVMKVELGTFDAQMPAGMQANRLTGAANIGKILVDKQWAVIIVKRAFTTDEVFDFINP